MKTKSRTLQSLLLACGLVSLALFAGCATADNAPNAFTVDFEENYGGVTQTSRIKIPHDLAANGLSIRALAQQGDVGDRADFPQAVDALAGRRVATKGVSDDAEKLIYEKEHLGLEVTLFQPTLVNQEAIALANVELQKAISSDNTEQIQAWGSIISELTAAGLKAFVPIP